MILPESHTGSREALGRFPDPKGGGRQRGRRRGEGRRESQAKDGSQPRVPTFSKCQIPILWMIPVENSLQGRGDLVRDCCKKASQEHDGTTWVKDYCLCLCIERSVYCCCRIQVARPDQGKVGLWRRFLLNCKTDLTASCLIASTQFGRTIRGQTSAITYWLLCQSDLEVEVNLIIFTLKERYLLWVF